MAEWLRDKNVDVQVITTSPYYPQWSCQEGYNAYRYYRKRENGILVTRCPLWIPIKQSGFKRILHQISFAFTSFPVFLFKLFYFKPDLVFLNEPPLMCSPAVLLGGRLFSVRTWLHIQDFEIDAAFSLGILKSRFLRWLLGKIESAIIKKFDWVSTISDNMLKRAFSKGSFPETTLFLPNWVDTREIFPLPDAVTFRHEFNMPKDKTILLYSGNLGEKQGLECLIDAAAFLQENGDDEFHFVICGEGGAKKD